MGYPIQAMGHFSARLKGVTRRSFWLPNMSGPNCYFRCNWYGGMKSARLGMRRYLGEGVAYRLCQNVALLALIGILIVEGAILAPPYCNHQRDLLLRLGHVGEAIVGSALRSEGRSSKRKI